MGVEGEIVFTEDLSSGRVHKRVKLGDSLASLEGCNQDAAGAYEILPSIDAVDPSQLCKRCFAQGREGSGLD